MGKNLDRLSILGSFIEKLPNSPDEAKLEVFNNPKLSRNYWIEIETSEYTSLCPKTGQPDFGKIILRYIPDKKCIETKSFKLFISSFRNTGIFVEDAINKILDKIVKNVKPRQALVRGEFNSRGGVFINIEVKYNKKG